MKSTTTKTLHDDARRLLDEWDAKLEKAEHRLKEAKTDSELAAREKVRELRRQRKDLEARLAAARDEAKADASELKHDLKFAADEFQSAARRVLDEFRS